MKSLKLDVFSWWWSSSQFIDLNLMQAHLNHILLVVLVFVEAMNRGRCFVMRDVWLYKSYLNPQVGAWINFQQRCTSPLCLLLISTSAFPLPFLSCLLLSLPPCFICIYLCREESGQKPSVSSGTAKGHTDLDGPLFHRNGTKGDGEFTWVFHVSVFR